MTSRDLSSLQNKLGIQFNNPELLRQALTHASTGEGLNGHNERLEFLGDAVLDLIIAEHLYTEHPERAEGDLTECKAMVVSRTELARAASQMSLEKWIIVGRGIKKGDSLPRSILSNTLEALIGAYYLDSGLEPTKKFTLQFLRISIDRALQEAVNFKMLLQNYTQKKWNEVPSYELVTRGGPSFSRSFLIQAVVHGEKYPPAWGKTKKEAEQWAAREALLQIEHPTPPSDPEHQES